MFPRVHSLVNVLFRRQRFERDMADEMTFHMQAYAADLVRRGLSVQEAERRARIEFGSIESAREESRQARGLRIFDETRQDVRFALRQLVKAPGFTTAAVVSLALGIGASTAIFSITDAVMFRTLPVSNPEALVYLGHTGNGDTSVSANYPLLERYRAANIFAGVTLYEQRGFSVRTADGFENVDGQFVSGNYHAVIGVAIALGRGFSNEPDRPDGREPTAVISDAYWERKFGRSPDVIGQTLTIGGHIITIVGVTAPEFHGLNSGARIDVTLPLFVRAMDEPEFLEARDGWVSVSLVARTTPNAAFGQTQKAADAVFTRFWMEPENAWARGRNAATIRHAALQPAAKGSAALRDKYAKPLAVLMSLVGIVLFIACANVANLLLARGSARAKEIAVRLSIGAGRRRIVRQLITESFLLSACGGVLGLVVAAGSTHVVASLLASGQWPTLLDVTLNARVLAFTTAICVVTAVAFGLTPALSATAVHLSSTLKDGGTATARRTRIGGGKTLVAAQVALCVVMIATAGLLVRTLHNLRTLEAGFGRTSLLLFNVDTYQSKLSHARRIAVYSQILEALRAIPGVVSAAYGERSPVDFSEQRRKLEIPGSVLPAGVAGVSSNVVTPGYFSSFGIRLLRGRYLSTQDRVGTPNVAVVSETMARSYFRGADAIGRTIALGGNKLPMTIVGIVSDVRHEHLREAPPPMVYTPLAQPTEAFDGGMGYPGRLTAVIQTSVDPAGIVALARRAVSSVSKDVPITYTRTMEQQLDAALVRERMLASLAGGFAFLALLLAFVGLYGVMSYNVMRRAREICIRVAFGATSAVVLGGVLREALVVCVWGIVIGLAGTLIATQFVSSFLFGLSPRDPGTLGAVAAMLIAIALLAGYLPARRAAATDPMSLLKGE